jgi:hypothetical protein
MIPAMASPSPTLELNCHLPGTFCGKRAGGLKTGIMPSLTAFLMLSLPLPLCAVDPSAREKELTYLRTVMGGDLLPYARLEVTAAENIAILGSGAEQYLGLHLFPGQKKLNGGIRAEVSVDYPCKQGDTVRYAWRFMVPEGFKSDAPQNRWWIFGQWHDQPDKNRGETWDGFASKSPPVLLGLGELQGRIGFGFEYGPTQAQKQGPFFIVPGKWHHIAVVIRWSQKEDGTTAIFLDDMTTPVATATGANMQNAYQHYLKIGMYRHPGIQTENWLYLDDLKISLEK